MELRQCCAGEALDIADAGGGKIYNSIVVLARSWRVRSSHCTQTGARHPAPALREEDASLGLIGARHGTDFPGSSVSTAWSHAIASARSAEQDHGAGDDEEHRRDDQRRSRAGDKGPGLFDQRSEQCDAERAAGLTSRVEHAGCETGARFLHASQQRGGERRHEEPEPRARRDQLTANRGIASSSLRIAPLALS
jgi:hypothetical protein